MVKIRFALGAIININVGSFYCNRTLSYRIVKESVNSPDSIVLALIAA